MKKKEILVICFSFIIFALCHLVGAYICFKTDVGFLSATKTAELMIKIYAELFLDLMLIIGFVFMYIKKAETKEVVIAVAILVLYGLMATILWPLVFLHSLFYFL